MKIALRLAIVLLLITKNYLLAQDPVTNPSGFTATCTDAGLVSWTNPGTINSIVIFAKAGSAITVGTPSLDVVNYTPNTIFGSGTAYENDPDAFCIYNSNSTGTSLNITGLSPGVTYHFLAFNADESNYSTAHTFNGATLASLNNITGLINNPDDSQIQLNWTNPSCLDNVLIVARAGSAVSGSPTNSSYTFNTDFSIAPSATSDGFPNADEKIVYFGNSSPQTITGLTNGTTYHFRIFVVKGSTWSSGVTTSGTPVDSSPPFVVNLTPADGSDDFQISNTEFIIEFNENIEKVPGAASNDNHRIILYRSPATSVLTLDRTNANISVSGNTATITFNPPYQLLTNTDYHIIVGNQVFRDADGTNAFFPGLTTSSAWNFRTSGITVNNPNLSACSGVFQTLPDITIDENGNGDFNQNAGTRTIIFGFSQPGFVFQPNNSVNVTTEGTGTPLGTNVTITSAVTTFNTLTINYTVSGTDRKERIRISGLRISPDGTQPSTTIIRTGGNANMDGGNGTGGSSLTYATITSGTLPATPNGINLDLLVCQNDVISSGPNITSNNTSTRWYTDISLTTEIVSLANETNINTPIKLTNLGFTTSNSGSITRYVTQTLGGCQSLARSLTLTVQPKPTADLLITSGSTNLCTNYLNGSPQPQPIQFTASPSGGTNYHFQRNGAITLQNGASRTLNSNSEAFNNGDQISVIVTAPGSCPSLSNIVAITKNTGTSAVDFVLANPPTGTPNTTAEFSNQQAPVELSGSPPGGVFTGSGIFGNFFHPGSVPIGTYPITYTYTDANGCTGVRTRDFNVYDGSTAFSGLSTTYCADDPVFQITPDSRPGYVFLYILPRNYYFAPLLAAGSVVSANGYDVTFANEFLWFQGFVNTSGPMTINPLAITDNGTTQKEINFFGAYRRISDGLLEFREQNVTFFPRPNSPSAVLAPGYCLGAGNILDQVVSVLGSNVRWFNDFALTDERIALAGNDSPTLQDLGLSATAGTYFRYVTQSIGACQSNPTTITINIFDQPSVPIAPSPAAYCARDLIANLTATGSSLRWYAALPVTPANQIPVSNPLSVQAIELGINNNTPGTYVRYVTQTINGCQSNATTVTVTINPIPVEPGASFTRTYCLNDAIPGNQFVVSGSNIRWYRDFDLTNQIMGISNPNNPNAVTDLGLSTNIPSITRFYVTQTLLGCQSPPITITVEVNDLPVVSFTSSADLMKVCKTDERINIRAFPPGGSWSGTGSGALVNTNIPEGTTELNPAALDPATNYSLTYNFTSLCSNTTSQTISVFPSVNPSLNIGSACNGFFVDIINSSTVTPPASTTIVEYFWNFGDGDILESNTGVIPAGTHGGNTTGVYNNPSHLFRNASNLISTNYNVTYSMKTADGCTISTQEVVTVNPVPNVDFTWTNACLGTPTQFNATTNPNLDAAIETYTWNFNKTNTLSASIIGTGKTPATTYNAVGRDSVQLIVKTFANCRDTVQKPIFIVPTFDAINSTTSYEQNFNTNTDGWINGGSNSSWQFGLPAGAVISRDSSASGSGNAWVTNRTGLYNPLEKSWVLSRCFSFETSKPVLAMDIWADTPGGIDGAVLQYNVSGDILNDNDWVVVGTVNSGINWYQQQGIASKPGNQSQFDYGWSGNREDGRYKSWRHVVHKLDGIVGGGVVFRIAFSSTNTGTREGFAFDNVFIGERNRNVLVENFTNATATDVVTHNQLFNTLPSGGSSEIIKMQFHTNFPGVDPQNQLFPTINNARTAFYGITTAPTLRIDGLFNPTGPATQWAEALYDNRVLEPSPIRIDINTPVKDGSLVRISASITNTTSATISLQGANVFVAIVEKDVSPYLNVVRQLLPNAAGITINQTLDPGQSMAIPELIWSDRNLVSLASGNSAIIVFVQSINAGNQQVLQAQIFDSPVEPDITTSIEDPTFAASIQVYPNPANREVNIVLPQAARTAIPIVMVDAQGRQIYTGQFATGEQQKTIITTEMASGLYILHVQAPEGIARKKVMVVHEK
ncbi:MAG: T9SS type A sorting domain-containing protein [Cyclobacteriaceae bacterium]|nr:T9SS type A sorting domain-containing protein [Cyclobacteriaceae bacterium]